MSAGRRAPPATPRLSGALLAAWRESLPSEEWRELEPGMIARGVAEQLQLGMRRRTGQLLLSLRAARTPGDAVLQLISEDMPFLVDTLQMGLARARLALRLLVHPVLHVRRDASGRLQSLRGASGNAAPSDAPLRRESWQYLRIEAPAGTAEAQALLRDLRAALSDLRRAVSDWGAMRRAVLRLCARLAQRPPPLPPEVLAESRALLQYMEAHHFTFLGMRDYRLRRAGGRPRLAPVPGSGLGLLRVSGAEAPHEGAGPTPANIRRALRSPELLVITQANSRSSVHRPGYLDYVGIKSFDAQGRIVGETRILGLWTSSAYSADPREVPWVRLKMRRVIEHFPFTPDGHDGKRLVHILENLPREELLQAPVADLVRCARVVLSLQERARVRLYLRRDEFHRFWSCLVFVPRERMDAAAEQRITELLRTGLHGSEAQGTLALGEDPLAQLHVIVRAVDTAALSAEQTTRLERRLAAALVSWRDQLRSALIERLDEQRGLQLERRYATAFSDSYRQDVDPALAVDDILDLESIDAAPERMQLRLYRPAGQKSERIHLRILRRGEALSVFEVLPTFEHFGLRVIAERPYQLRRPDGASAGIQDFELEHFACAPVALEAVGDELIRAFRAVRAGLLDDDGFNRLLIAARLSARQATVLRACCRYLLQTGIAFSQAYMERVLADHAATARELVELFEQRLAPATHRAAAKRARLLERRVRRAIAAVNSADEDRILRAFLAVIGAVVRTNYFVGSAEGTARPWLSLKLDPKGIPGLPAPRPAFEIFVYSPRVEGVHLRMGPIARGGIRWSERPEDFRTEILGLMKAQHVKNTLIVPVGAKGGFVARRLPSRAPRELVQQEVVQCYQSFIRGLLDLTDNIVQGRVQGPPQVRRLDAEDPYLVVAADKGTASFSDVANAISAEYAYWLGDAFASGGSAGYDHKKMGITARGAWVCVRRHFRELGRDIQREPFSVAGIGDMSGDVFGNGMLQSRRIRLVAAFDHRHIFIDPDPDPRTSFAERARMFRLPRSSWADYQTGLLSAGGAIYERSNKEITVSAQAQALLDLPERRVTPTELIRAILCMRVDLLWNGGIGTYVKATSERNGEIGDRANDGTRVDGRQVRALVVGEGGNLGFSQRGRIEYAVHGGRLNADFIDNSAGVNTSDVEVNLKIALDSQDNGGPLPLARRNRLLRASTDEVAGLVLRNNYLQTQAISVMESRATTDLSEHQRLLHWLERQGELDRAVEFLPDDEQIEERRRQGRGLTRPELALLLAYGKIALNHALAEAGIAADPYLALELQRYFPEALRKRYAARIEHHRLRAQIITTAITNSCVNRVGPTLLMECAEQSGADAGAVARAYTVARDSAELRGMWVEIETLDGRVLAVDQYQALWHTSRFLRHATLWLLEHRSEYPAIGSAVARLQPMLRELVQLIPSALVGIDRERYLEERQHRLEQGFPERLAGQLAGLGPMQAALDLCELIMQTRQPARRVAHTHFGLAGPLALDWLHSAVERLPGTDDWQRAAKGRLMAAARGAHLRLTAASLHRARSGSGSADARTLLERWQTLVSSLRALQSVELPALIVAVEELENLAAARPRVLAL